MLFVDENKRDGSVRFSMVLDRASVSDIIDFFHLKPHDESTHGYMTESPDSDPDFWRSDGPFDDDVYGNLDANTICLLYDETEAWVELTIMPSLASRERWGR